MTFFGETLRKARETKGLTTSQVADRTHILVQIIEAMEREDFKRIPAAIYGRGFVRHISEVLEIDPKPLVAEFMEIYEGRKPPASAAADPFQPRAATTPAAPTQESSFTSPVETPPIAETPIEAPPALETSVEAPSAFEAPAETTPEIEPPSPPAEPPPDDLTRGLDLFDPPPPPPPPQSVTPPPSVQHSSTRTLWTGNDVQPVLVDDSSENSPAAPEPPPDIPPVTRAQDIFSSAYAEPHDDIPAGPSAAEKFRESLSAVSHGVIGSVRRIPRSAWRMAVLIVGAVAVIGLLVWGCKVLYRITEQPAAPAARQQVVPAAKATTAKPAVRPTAKPSTLRTTGQKVPPLYVD